MRSLQLDERQGGLFGKRKSEEPDTSTALVLDNG